MNLLTLLAQAMEPANPGDGGAGVLLGEFHFAGVWLLFFVGLVFFLLTLAVWVWALIDAIRNPALADNERLIWILVIVLTSCLGALIYLIVGRKGGVGRSAP